MFAEAWPWLALALLAMLTLGALCARDERNNK